MKTVKTETILLTKIVGGGQALGELADGKKCFVWGGLPSEKVEVQITKSKSRLAEGVVTSVLEPSPDRIKPADPESYLSTSPWQIMSFESEQTYKSQLIDEAFTMHHVKLANPCSIYSDNVQFGYRNKVEFSWYGSVGNGEPENKEQLSGVESNNPASNTEQLDLAFFRRGSRGKIIVDGTTLARPEINTLARTIRDLLQTKPITARNLKTLLIRCDKQGNCVWQLYVKDKLSNVITEGEASALPAQGGEIIYSDARSPASVITKRLDSFGNTVLSDEILGTEFRYATEGFFQVNLPVYEQALRDMQRWVEPNRPTVDLYSGVGSIGLTIGGIKTTLVEINSDAVREMRENIARLDSRAKAILAPSEKALEYVDDSATIIVDPPRAGLHEDVTNRLLDTVPPRIIYLSCNPVTQARDVAKLLEKYIIVHAGGYNFFPRTPHIEHLIVLDRV